MSDRYRLEWRPATSAEVSASLALAQESGSALEARTEAVRLIESRLVLHGEVKVSVLRENGAGIASAVADMASILSWRVDEAELPIEVESSWRKDDEKASACLQAGAALRRSLNRAVRAGALDISQALGLIAHSSRLLDPDED